MRCSEAGHRVQVARSNALVGRIAELGSLGQESSDAQILSHIPNSGIVHLPGRRFPVIVMQGDTLWNVFESAKLLLAEFKRARDDERYYETLMFAEQTLWQSVAWTYPTWFRSRKDWSEMISTAMSRRTNRPNKAPEPTSTSVTPRAFECMSELNPKNPARNAARGAPAVAVAHL